MESVSKKNKNLILHLLVDFGFAFMFCIFAPIDLYYANFDEFWFYLGQMMQVCVVAFAALFVVLGLISFFISKTKVSGYYLLVKFVVFIYLYIQGNFIPRNYGVMNGEPIEWGSYTLYAVLSILLLAVCVALYIFLFRKFKNHLGKIIKYVTLFVLLVQLFTIGTLIVSHGLSSSEKVKVVTSKELFDFSKDSNLVVILLDTYEGNDLNHLIEEDYDNQAKIFENFTYYKDTLGAYPTTRCALPHILTGERYRNEIPYGEYVQNAYDQNDLYNEFEKNGYKLDVYTDPAYLSDNTDLYENVTEGHYYIRDAVRFAKSIYKMAAFNYVPHQMKKMFVYDTATIAALKETDSSDEAYNDDDIVFNNKINQDGITVSKSGNLFKFYHLQGVHGPYTFGKNLIEDDGDYESYDEAAGCDEILKTLFSKMKEERVYDPSTIVVLADHGHRDYSQNPVFLIKNPDEKHEFAISGEKMTYDYLNSIWKSIINGEIIDEEYIKACGSGDDRLFLYYSWSDNWEKKYLPDMYEMICNGEASDAGSLTVTGTVYGADNENREYTLGKVLDLKEGEEVFKYVLYGITYFDIRNKALMKFDITEEYENLLVEFNLRNSSGCGNASFYAGDKLVSDIVYDNQMEKLSFVIPHEYTENGQLSLMIVQDVKDGGNNGFLQKSPMKIHYMSINSTDEDFNLENQITSYSYTPGDKLIFTDEDFNARKYYDYGFGSNSSRGTWTNGKEAGLKFRFDAEEDLMLNMEYDVFDGPQEVGIYANDTLLETYKANGSEEHSVKIPKECLKRDILDITFKLPDAHTDPSDESENKKELGLGFKSLSISPIE